MRILTVDPEPRLTAPLRQTLRRAGHEILLVTSLGDAVQVVSYGRIELVLVNGDHPDLEASILRDELRSQGHQQPVIGIAPNRNRFHS